MANKSDSDWTWEKIARWSFIPLLYVAGSIFLFDISICKLTKLSLNESGDFLAGFFAPLTFYFLVLGYYQSNKALRIQGEDLSVSNKSLAAQIAEMKKSVAAQEEMTNIAWQQYNAEVKRNKELSSAKLRLRAITEKPNIEVRSNNGEPTNFSNLSFRVNLKVENLDIFSVKISSHFWTFSRDGETPNMYEHEIEFDKLSLGKRINLVLNKIFSKEDKYPLAEPSYIEISYYDDKGREFIEEYKLYRNANNRIMFTQNSIRNINEDPQPLDNMFS